MVKIPLSLVIEAIEERDQCLSHPGFCLACGERAEGVEPDARRYECEICGEEQVYGAEEIVLKNMFK